MGAVYACGVTNDDWGSSAFCTAERRCGEALPVFAAFSLPGTSLPLSVHGHHAADVCS